MLPNVVPLSSAIWLVSLIFRHNPSEYQRLGCQQARNQVIGVVSDRPALKATGILTHEILRNLSVWSSHLKIWLLENVIGLVCQIEKVLTQDVIQSSARDPNFSSRKMGGAS